MKRGDRNAFLEKAEARLLDEALEDKFGHRARERPDLSGFSPTSVELQFLMDACIAAHNRARQEGRFMEATIHFRNMNAVAAIDPELQEALDEAMRDRGQHPLEQLLGGDQRAGGGPF